MTVLVSPALAGPERAADPDRVVDKAEIIATRPPDADHQYPLELESLVPVEHSPLVVSTHRGPGRGDEVAVWLRVAGGYRRLETFVVDEPGSGSYLPVAPFRYGGRLFLLVSFVASGTAQAHNDTVLVLDSSADGSSGLARVEMESPIDRFHSKLAPDESVQDGALLMLTDERLEWSFAIWKSGDPHCCPTGGRMRGTFTVCRGLRHDESTDRWITTWRMSVDEGTREPIDASAARPLGRIADSCLAGEVRSGVALPDASGHLPNDDR